MPRIKNIKNVIVNAQTSAVPFTVQTQFGFQPHEAIVRQISYFDPVTAKETGNYLVWCSLHNDYIGSFQVNNYGITVNPNIHILIQSMMPNTLEFRIDTLDANGKPIIETALTGDITIHIDFISY